MVVSVTLKVRLEAGPRLMRPIFPKSMLAELDSGVVIVPFEKNVRPLKACSPFTRTKGFALASAVAVTVISPAAEFFSGNASTNIVWPVRMAIVSTKTIKCENTELLFMLFIQQVPP
jgi:hypothetical protein